MVRINIAVTNTGKRRGSEVIQGYIAPSVSRLTRPPKELKAFAKVWLDPGETTTVELEFDGRAFAYFDSAEPTFEDLLAQQRAMNAFAPAVADVRTASGWYVDAGDYTIEIGTSSANIAHSIRVTAPDEFTTPR